MVLLTLKQFHTPDRMENQQITVHLCSDTTNNNTEESEPEPLDLEAEASPTIIHLDFQNKKKISNINLIVNPIGFPEQKKKISNINSIVNPIGFPEQEKENIE